MEKSRVSGDNERNLESGNASSSNTPADPAPSDGKRGLHPAFYIALWIACSSGVILFNKWVLASAKFDFPLFLTTWHMLFATAVTQGMAHFTNILDSRFKVGMDRRLYMKAIFPIGIVFSLSLICGNLAYIYLSVSFIQMLKATNAVVTLLITWSFGMAPPNFKVLGNVMLIVVGVVIASFGELKFDLIGFIFQVAGIVFEALRLVMVQRILSHPDYKMDPIVSLYYYAPACAITNGALAFFVEVPRLHMADVLNLGIGTLIANAFVAFMLNVSVVLLIGQTSAVVLTMAGVLKDILLVVASIVLFGDPVTAQQYFGYSIALGGLTYYKLGAEKVNNTLADAQLKLGSFRQNHPAKVRGLLILAFASVVTLGYLAWQPSALGPYTRVPTV